MRSWIGGHNTEERGWFNIAEIAALAEIGSLLRARAGD
jgi:hypothetical protein